MSLDYLRPVETGDQQPIDHFGTFAERYRQYFPRVFAFVYGRVQNAQVAEDLVSEVFERAFLKADSLRNSEAFGTWLFTIARNVVNSHGRKLAREHTNSDPEILSAIASGQASIESQILQREKVACLLAHVRCLSQREQEIISLKFDGGLANKQIAEIIGLSEVNVRVILYRALRKLRDMLAVNPNTA